MKGLSHQDEVIARTFFSSCPNDFGHWVQRKDESIDHFAGMAEAATVFVALCAGLKTIGDASESMEKITTRACKLVQYAKGLFKGNRQKKVIKLSLCERVLIIVFDTYMTTGKGISSDRLMALTGATQPELEKELKRFESNGIIRQGKSGWLVVH